MFPILVALLLAAWFVQPWSYVEHGDTPVNTGHEQKWTETREHFYVASAARMERLFAREAGVGAEASAESELTSPPTPTPPATPTPVPASAATPASAKPPQLSSDALRALICSYPWPCEEALRVKWCESGSRWDAIGAGANYGGFQINAIHANRIQDFWTSWMDPEKNTAWAFDIWSRQGWKPWGCRPI